MKQYVVFYKPNALDGLDWVYRLLEDREPLNDFYLVEAQSPAEARGKTTEEIYTEIMKKYDIEFISETAFQGLGYFAEQDNEEILERFGVKDGSIIIKLFDKYIDPFLDDEISFYETSRRYTLDTDERDAFLSFDDKTIKILFDCGIQSELLVVPITKVLK